MAIVIYFACTSSSKDKKVNIACSLVNTNIKNSFEAQYFFAVAQIPAYSRGSLPLYNCSELQYEQVYYFSLNAFDYAFKGLH